MPMLPQRGLRTPPSLIAEAAVHYGLDIQIEDLRLCIRERLDGVPTRFYLGISALRFIEGKRLGDAATCHWTLYP